MNLLTSLEDKYHSMSGWQKAVVIVPFVLLGIILILLYILRDRDSSAIQDFLEKRRRRQIDEEIEEAEKVDKELQNKREAAKEFREEAKRLLGEDNDEANKTINDIDTAVANDDYDELERIRRRLNERARNLRRTS